MQELSSEPSDIQAIYLLIAQYPILAQQIRRRMREELIRRGIVTAKRLEQEVHEKAVLSQQREGLNVPLVEEDKPTWEQRQQLIRDHLTDFYFAYNLSLDILHRIVEELLAQRKARRAEAPLPFNPELAPPDLLLAKAQEYEAIPIEERGKVQHHLEEISVVLLRTMVSDHLGFLHVAKRWFTAEDFRFIRARRIGKGKIGGKAAGMLLAWKILQGAAPSIAQHIIVPNSYFIGADVFYDFLELNGLEYNQKYKSSEQIRAEYPQIQAACEQARFPEETADRLRDILRQVGNTPLIVRSSSLLEDNFGTSFAGKYESYFCPNQGTLKENLRELTLAIRRIYASVHSPDALFYRRQMGLIDYDERMAILLQEVQGQTYHDYFFPTLAGVAFSYSPIVWSPVLRREEGFVRLVLGMGTRAVERVGEDYPRLVMLSHPTIRPDISDAAIRRHSQHLIDLIDLKNNVFTSLPVGQALGRDYPPLPWVASINKEEMLMPIFGVGPDVSPNSFVLTFDNLLQHSKFAALIKSVLSTLAEEYQSPVDVEFAASLAPGSAQPRFTLHLLQCRPQSSMTGEAAHSIPADLPAGDKLFLVTRLAPQGYIGRVEYIVYLDPAAYGQTTDPIRRKDIARAVGQLNAALEKHTFILMGPGRWGSSNILLGVPVTYADIYNARALVEIALKQGGITPEPSYGTHFFQDLVEAHIYPLAIYPDEPGDLLNREFIERAQNHLADILPDENCGDCVKVIHVPSERAGHHLEIAMDGKLALAYFASDITASA